MAISTRGIGTQATASRPVCRHAANSRREPRQSTATETQSRICAEAKRRDRTAMPDARRDKPPRQKRIAGRAPRQTAATETQSWTCAEVKRRDRNAMAGRVPMAKRRDRNAKLGINRWQNAVPDTLIPSRPQFRIPNSAFFPPPAVPRAHNRLCRSYNRPAQRPRRLTIHEHMKTIGAGPRQRGITQ